jgi:4-hydroxybenzoate polyprenyltransferase
MMQGVPREINNITMVIIMAVIGVLAWKRPLLGGILLAVYAILMSIYFLLFNNFLSTALVGMVLFCAPVVIAGFLFVEADWTSKQKN